MPPDWSTPNNRELFTRWFQFGTFSPIFRIHGKGERAIFSKNWDEPTRAILMKYDNLRYRLLPYIYSLGWRVTSEGYTIMRSMAFDFRNDEGIKSIPDQYMFGSAFLVNPITWPMYSAANANSIKKVRKVYLPASTKWYDFWTGKVIEGGQTIDAAAPIETIPLYVKAGSIVPMGPYLQYATEKPADPLEIRIYAGADVQFVLYEDENDTYNYEKGRYSTITLTWNDKLQKLTIGERKGEFSGMLANRTFNVVWVGPKNGTGIEPAAKFKTVAYNGKETSITR
jgi:alpha-D-xyloside xylohydrolase